MRTQKNPYDEFNHSLLQGEATSREKAQAWKTAIGLQEVDGLSPSDYLLKTAKRHIDGDISIDDVRDLPDAYYESKDGRPFLRMTRRRRTRSPSTSPNF